MPLDSGAICAKMMIPLLKTRNRTKSLPRVVLVLKNTFGPHLTRPLWAPGVLIKLGLSWKTNSPKYEPTIALLLDPHLFFKVRDK